MKMLPKFNIERGKYNPLIHCENMSKITGIDLYVKYEGANPTGSFKDSRYGNGCDKSKRER